MPQTDHHVPDDESDLHAGAPPTGGDLPSEPSSGNDTEDAGHLFSFHEDFTLDRMFTAREAELVRRLTAFSRDGAGDAAQSLEIALDDGYHRLGAIALAMESYPALGENTKLADKERSLRSLVDTLERGGGHAIEWSLPTKAILSRTYGIAKVNFWTSLKYVLTSIGSDESRDLLAAIEEAIEEAVYTRLAEELYGSFAASQNTTPELKRVAVEHVIDLWEGRVRFATYQFCPILRSAWRARQRAPRVFGTMMGAQEIFQLLFQDCDERFLEVFTEGDTDEQTVQAFEEFLFDLAFESLEEVRQKMADSKQGVIGPDEVADFLGYSTLRPMLAGAKDLYSSFRRRRVKAQYRTSMGVPGPRRTAESYVLEALLVAEAREAGA
ncbi:MAG: hypothetical protein QNJ98_17025 [Planctomycetota bacterium]|nr:hypothetical protein [Planctomycetota bacterium]